MTTHYEVLDVRATANQAEIRRAYHAQANRWHPDRFVDAPDNQAAGAEIRMRQINEAWRVLGDPVARTAYDRQPTGPTLAVGSGKPTRVDPRLLDPEILSRRARQQQAASEEHHNLVLKLAPYLALVLLLVAIFLFTAYATSPDAGESDVTVPGPEVPFAPGACLRVLSEGVVEVPNCQGIYEGRLIGVRLPNGVCTEETTSEVAYRDLVLCLG